MIASRKEIVFESALIASMLCVYAINRFTPLFDALLPFDIAKNHLNDMCAGAMFPAYVNALCIACRSGWRVASLRSALVLGAVCCLAWEGAAPLIVPWSVGDPIDCACYIVGALAFAALRRTVVGAPVRESSSPR